MKLPRRTFLHLAAGAATLEAVSRVAWAQAYPSRPITMVVPFPPGGPLDTVGRITAESMGRDKARILPRRREEMSDGEAPVTSVNCTTMARSLTSNTGTRPTIGRPASVRETTTAPQS
jgi:hypothetical protein